MSNGILIISAPSGCGKSTIVNWLMENHPELRLSFSVSCTSRPPRGREQNGVEYFFVTPEEFRQHIRRGDFLEYEEVYKDRFYGTLRSRVDAQLEQGQTVVCDVDVLGAQNIKKAYGDRALSLFIMPPSIETLRQRLEHRGTETPEVIRDRLARATFEISQAPKFDCTIVNDNLAKAEEDAYRAIRQFLDR